MGLVATTTNLSYARNEYIKQGRHHVLDRAADMIYYVLSNNDIPTDELTVSATWTTAGDTGRPLVSNLTTDVQLGSYANALKGNVVLSTNGGASGLLSAVCCEITMATVGDAGNYAAVELEMTYGATSGSLPKPCFIYANTSGTANGDFDTYGDLMKIGTGLTAGTGLMIGTGTSTLRIGTGALSATKRYIPLSTVAETYTTAYPIVSTYSGGNAISVTVTATTTSGYTGITVNNSFTKTNGGVHKGISSTVTYTPSGGGYSTPIGVVGKVSLGANFDTGTGYVWGVQGQLDFGTSHTINQANSVFAGVRGVITGTTPTFTDADEICCVYADNLCATNMAGMSTGSSSFFRAHNGGGTMDNFLHLWGANNVSNFVSFESTAGATPMISGGAATHSGTIKKVRCLVDGSVYYFTISTAVS